MRFTGQLLVAVGLAGLLAVQSAEAVVLQGSIQGRRTVRADESPLQVPANLVIPEGSSLWIEAGVTVQLGAGACLIVDGEIHALGEKRAPIRFEPADAANRWGNIKVLGDKDLPCYDGNHHYIDGSGGSRLIFCEFRGGGHVPDQQYEGGALYLNGSAPLVRDCLFQDNKSDRGGAVVCYNFATPLIEACTFEGNASLLDDGGAVYCFFYSDALIYRNFFVRNEAMRHAGALYISVSNPLVQENAFIDNVAGGWGGTLYVSSSSPRVLDNALYEGTGEDRSTGLVFQADCRPEVRGNSLLSGGVEVYGLNLSEGLDLSGNWWGTLDEFLINGKVQQRGRGKDRALTVAPWRDKPVANLLTQPVEIISLHAMADNQWADTLAFDLCDGALARIRIVAVDRNPYAVDQTSAEVSVSDRPGEAFTLIFMETEKASGIFHARLSINREVEDTPRVRAAVGQHLVFASTANPDLRCHYRVDEARPVVHQLAILSDPDPTHVIEHAIQVGWAYFSLLGEPQQAWQLQVSSDSSFQRLDMWDSGSQAASPEQRLLAYAGQPLQDGARYFLRLRAQGGGAWSAWRAFMIRSDNPQQSFRLNSLPPVPTQQDPAADVILAQVRPQLKASLVKDQENDPVTYEFQLADDEFFQHIVSGTDGKTWSQPEWTVDQDLRDNQAYWWRVRVQDSFEAGEWSAPRRFHINPVEEAPAPFELVGPQGAIADLQPEFSWNETRDPDPLSSVTYTLLISTHEDLREAERITGLETLCHRRKSEFANRGTIYWAVEAVDNSGRITRSRQVHRVVPDTTPTIPLPLFPVQGEEILASQSLRITPSTDPWPEDRLVYEIQLVVEGGDFAKPLCQWKNLKAEELGTTSIESYPDARLLVDDRSYAWRIRAVDNHAAASDWSAPATFWFNRGNNPPAKPDQDLQPADAALLRTDPVISWQAVVDPDQSDPASTLTYVVQLSQETDFKGRVVEQRLTGQTRMDLAGQLADNQRWYWRVQALDNENTTSGWSEIRHFILNKSDEAPTGLAWLEPATDARLHRLDQIDLKWQAASDADWNAHLTYTWSLAAVKQPGVMLASGNTQETSTSVRVPLQSREDYLLHLSVKDETGLEQKLEARRVTVDSHPSAPVPLLSKDELGPADALAWQAATDPDPADKINYRVRVRNEGGRVVIDAAGLSATQAILSRLPGGDQLPEDQPLTWIVTASDPHGLEATSEEGRFWFNRGNNAPSAPTFAAELTNRPVLRTDRPTLPFTPGTDPDHSDPPASLWHELQASSEAGFANPTTHRVEAGASSVTGLVLGDNLRWHLRLRCLDDAGTPSPWSPPVVVTINMKEDAPTAPQLRTPTSGQKLYDLTGLDLAWTEATDPDPDAVITYRIVLEASGGAVLQTQETKQTNVRLKQVLRNGQELQVIVHAVDDTGLETPAIPLRVVVDSTPGPVSISGRPGQVLGVADQLTWTEAADPDPADQLEYELAWSGSRAFGESRTMALRALKVSLGQIQDLPENGEVWFRVRARDQHKLEGPWSDPWQATWDARNEAPQWSGNLRPAGDVLNRAMLNLSWDAPRDPDARTQQLTVEVQLASDESFRNLMDTKRVDAGAGSVELALQENRRHWVRARVTDQDGAASEWSAVESYLVNERAEAPVAPVLKTPRDGFESPVRSVEFHWQDGTDPDPGETPAHVLVLEGPSGERRVPVNGGGHQLDLDSGAWRWTVEAVDPGGLATRSATRSLTVK